MSYCGQLADSSLKPCTRKSATTLTWSLGNTDDGNGPCSASEASGNNGNVRTRSTPWKNSQSNVPTKTEENSVRGGSNASKHGINRNGC